MKETAKKAVEIMEGKTLANESMGLTMYYTGGHFADIKASSLHNIKFTTTEISKTSLIVLYRIAITQKDRF